MTPWHATSPAGRPPAGGDPDRRRLLGAALALAAGSALPRRLAGQAAGGRTPRPHLLVAAEKAPGLRTVDELRASVRTGHGRLLWTDLQARADADLKKPPLAGGSRNYQIVNATATRVLRHALASLVTERSDYRAAALAQIRVTFDSSQWTDWRDAAAPKQWHTGLRMGQLALAFGLAYDWLHSSMTAADRRELVAGVDRCGIQPYLKAVDSGSWVVGALNNFVPVICGGLAIAGMAFEEDHPQSDRLVTLGRERVGAYLGEFGPDGEFNESVPYAASAVSTVAFFSILRYWTAGRPERAGLDRGGLQALTRFGHWMMYLTRPHGREALFGDGPKSATQRRISLSYVPALAAAARDGVLQWYYLNNLFPDQDTDGVRNYALELVWYDQSLAPLSPEGWLPRGRVFPANTGCVSSRTDWDPHATPSFAYGKAGRAYETHGHSDVGQVCLDAYGEPLLLDPGGYHAVQGGNRVHGSAAAHNVLIFDGEDMRSDRPLSRAMHNAPERRLTLPLVARFLAHAFDDARGGFWAIDSSDVYADVTQVRRVVVHLTPGVMVVWDEARLPRLRDVSLRWHTPAPAKLLTDGGFVVPGASGAQLASHVLRVDPGGVDVAARTHQETGDAFIEATLRGGACTLLSVFRVVPPGATATRWRRTEAGASIDTPDGPVDVSVTGGVLAVTERRDRRGWTVSLPR